MADEQKPTKAQQLIDGLAERRERHRERSRVYRIAVVAAGAVILLGGLAMTVLPGPAVVVIPIGLSLLALEFVWAETVLEKLARGADLALSWRPPRRAVLAAVAVLVLGVAAFLVFEGV